MTPEQALIRLYQQTAKRLRVQITSALANQAIGTAAYRQAQLDAVNRELARLGARTARLAPLVAVERYTAAAHAVDQALGLEGTAAFRFAGAHRRAATVLARNLVTRLDRTADVVGRRVDDAFRRVGLQEVAAGVTGGDTRREVSRAIARRLIHENVTDALTGFVDARGARWQLDTYAEMVARTTTREAMSAGTHNRLRDLGEKLITISAHGTQCDICQPYEGVTYALPDEEVDGYDTIDQLPPFHPNCLHVATPAAGTAERFLRALEAA